MALTSTRKLPNKSCLMCYRWFIICWAACLLLSSFVPTAANSGPAAVMTPLSGWAPSMMASMAQGTLVIAVECQESNGPESSSGTGIVILVCQPQKSSTKSRSMDKHLQVSEAKSTSNITPFHGLHLVTQQHTDTSSPLSSKVSHQLPSCLTTMDSPRGTVVCAMTGFLPDVDYLQRQMRVWREDLYTEQDDPSISSPQLAQALGRWIREYESARDRPLGVQGIVLGLSSSSTTAGHGAQMYTTDPSGQIRSWNGGATAMGGLHAMEIRRALHQRLKTLWTTKETSSSEKETMVGTSPKQALKVALGALLDTTEPLQSNNGDKGYDISKSMDVDAFLLWQSVGKAACLSRIDQTQLMQMAYSKDGTDSTKDEH